MAITFEKATSEVDGEIRSLIAKHHQHLGDCGVTIQCLIAHRSEGGEIVGGGAVKLHGKPCNAIVKINSLKDRAEGKCDATITLDGDSWNGLGSNSKSAILDHQLQCLDVMREEGKGEILTDDLQRPRLKRRKWDHSFNWFDAIAERHGAMSMEVKQARYFGDKHGQLYFGWLTPPDRPVETASAALEKIAEPPKTKRKKSKGDTVAG